MTSKSNVIDGQFGPYRTVSARLPEFLQRFPPDEGWGVEIEVRDPLSCRPGLMELYKECIRAGRTARSLPDSNDPAWKAVLFVAKLTKDGRTVVTASCLQAIEFEYDYESAETRARGRLMSACGFGPEVLDCDELRQEADRGKRIVPASPAEDVDIDDLANPADPDPEDADEPQIAAPSLPTPPKSESDISPQLQQQVDTLCTTLDAAGTVYTRPQSKKDALKFVRTHRGGNGSGNGASP